MATLLGEKKVRFFMGAAYRFVRVSDGEWVCISHDCVPGAIKEEIESEWD